MSSLKKGLLAAAAKLGIEVPENTKIETESTARDGGVSIEIPSIPPAPTLPGEFISSFRATIDEMMVQFGFDPEKTITDEDREWPYKYYDSWAGGRGGIVTSGWDDDGGGAYKTAHRNWTIEGEVVDGEGFVSFVFDSDGNEVNRPMISRPHFKTVDVETIESFARRFRLPEERLAKTRQWVMERREEEFQAYYAQFEEFKQTVRENSWVWDNIPDWEWNARRHVEEILGDEDAELHADYYGNKGVYGHEYYLQRPEQWEKFRKEWERLRSLYPFHVRGEIFVNFGGPVRTAGATNNRYFWVVQPDGTLRESDSHGNEGNRKMPDIRWSVVCPGDLALEWRKDFTRAPHEYFIHKRPVGKITDAQIEAVKDIEREIREDLYPGSDKYPGWKLRRKK
jgi:hypothetical protein